MRSGRKSTRPVREGFSHPNAGPVGGLLFLVLIVLFLFVGTWNLTGAVGASPPPSPSNDSLNAPSASHAGSPPAIAAHPVVGRNTPKTSPAASPLAQLPIAFLQSGRCFPLWTTAVPSPEGPQGCAGHDQAALSFFSDLPSAGNITWNFTLPVETSASQNQSALYADAWFGLPLAVPGAWLGLCYLEVQFYPDSSWSNPYGVPGQWSVAAVGWEINATSGVEDVCAASELLDDGGAGPGPFYLSQGDSVSLLFSSPSGTHGGEWLTVHDISAGASTGLALRDLDTSQPLEPAYLDSAYAGAIPWSPLAATPVAVGFDLGRSSSGPSNSSYNGCTPGVPPPTPSDPSVPCPSYNPASWNNNTIAPWKISAPELTLGNQESSPTQAGFSSSLGGSASVFANSKSCDGRIGSAYCTYPWFSYTCSADAFEFGATDYPSATDDFGQSGQYAGASQNILDLAAYLASPVQVPNCNSTLYQVSVGASGTSAGEVSFLSGTYSGTATSVGVGAGRYSVVALPTGTGEFDGWVTTGGVAVVSPSDPSTTVDISGNGTLTGTFGSSAPMAAVTIDTSGGQGSTSVTPGTDFRNGTPPSSVAAGGTVDLLPGLYSLQFNPGPGTAFSGWQLEGNAALSTSASALTVLDVRAPSALTLTAEYQNAPAFLSVTFGGHGNGTVEFDGTPAAYDPGNNTSLGEAVVPSGSYPVTATASAGWEFYGWHSAPSAVQSNSNNSSTTTVGPGNATVFAQFAALISLNDIGPSDGMISVGDFAPAASGSSVALTPGSYTLTAVPFVGFSFVSWKGSNTSNLWIEGLTATVARVQVNSTGTITAEYASGPAWSLTFVTAPAAGGTIQFNLLNEYSGSQTNDSVTNGSYAIRATAAYAYSFAGWNLTGSVQLVGQELVVGGSGGTVRANFVSRSFPVTFSVAPLGALTIGLAGSPVTNGATLELSRGSYALTAALAPNVTFLRWSTALGIASVNGSKLNVTLTVHAPGLVTALAAAFQVEGLTATPSTVDVGYPLILTTLTAGHGPFAYAYPGLPPGCATASTATLSCSPARVGNYPVHVSVTDPTGVNLSSGTIRIHVEPLPSISSFTSNLATVDVGATIVLSAAVSGGITPYEYSYSGLPSGCTSVSAPTLTCLPSAAGPSKVLLVVTDAGGVTAYANLSFTVNPALEASLQLEYATVTLGARTNLTVDIAGGTAPATATLSESPVSLNCSLPLGALNGTCVPAMAVSGNVNVTVSDSGGGRVTATAFLTVNPAPAIATFTAQPSDVEVSSPVVFNLTLMGGTAPFRVQFAGVPGGCAVPSNLTFSSLFFAFNCSPKESGSFTVEATVHDVFGFAASASVRVAVAGTSPPQAGFLASVPLWEWVALAAIGAGVVVLVVLLLRQQRKLPPTQRSSQPPSSSPTAKSPPSS